MSADGDNSPALEPEVLPPDEAIATTPSRSPAERAFGPLVAGILIDLVDGATFGSMGLIFGFALGSALTWYLTSFYPMRTASRLIWCAAAGIYCTIPFTEFIPVATLVGAIVRYREYRATAAPSPSDTPSTT